MSETKHTAGPWEVNPSLSGSFVIESMAGWVLCQRASWEGNSEESRANGYLMAAAPDLQEALMMADETFRDLGWHDKYEVTSAAIAKSKAQP